MTTEGCDSHTTVRYGGLTRHEFWWSRAAFGRTATCRRTSTIESRFYGELQSRITMRTPRCFYAGIEPDHYQSVVVLEDLDRRGVHWLRYSERQSFDRVAARIRAITKSRGNVGEPTLRAGQGVGLGPGAVREWVMGLRQPTSWAAQMAKPQGMACSLRVHDGEWLHGDQSSSRRQARSMPTRARRGERPVRRFRVRRGAASRRFGGPERPQAGLNCPSNRASSCPVSLVEKLEKQRPGGCGVFARSPLPDSNRRPLPYHGI
jgi:hypothetical protein